MNMNRNPKGALPTFEEGNTFITTVPLVGVTTEVTTEVKQYHSQWLP